MQLNIFDEAIEYHDILNPKIWSDNKLRSEVRSHILDIVSEFRDYIEVPIDIVDIHILGSNAAYNYTDSSDLDVHIIANFDMVDCNLEILQSLYNAKKSAFNDEYDISIHGVNVELYVEDIRATTISNGIYSVYKNMWIKYPVHIDNVPDIDLEPELSNIIDRCDLALESDDPDEVKSMIDSIYLMRKNALSTSGEFGKGNLIFKELRNQGIIQKLYDRYSELKSDELSLESHIINRSSKGK